MYCYRNKKIVQADLVHHIIEIKQDYSKRIDTGNLIYLTNSNNQLIHELYNKDKQTKDQIQRLLQSLLLKFKQEYCSNFNRALNDGIGGFKKF